MKIIVPGAALALTLMSWSAVAEEQSASKPQASMEDQCRLMGEQHGMKGEKMDAWMKRCMDIVEKMKKDMHSKAAGDGHGSPHGEGMDGHDSPHGGGMGDH